MKHKISNKTDLFEAHVTCMATLHRYHTKAYDKLVEWYEGVESKTLNADNFSVFNVMTNGYVVQVTGYHKYNSEIHVLRIWGEIPSLSVDQEIQCKLFEEDGD